MKQLQLDLELPLTNTQEILYTLIKQGHVSIFDFPYLSGFRTRVSELRLEHNLEIESINLNRCNKFGNHYSYKLHRLKDREQAIELYKKLTHERTRKKVSEIH